MTKQHDIEKLDEALLRYEIHIAHDDRRRKLADTLASKGLDPDGLHLIANHVMRSNTKSLAGVLVHHFNTGSWETMLKNLRKLQPQKDHLYDNRTSGQITDPHSWAFCRIVHDRASPDTVADELGVSVERIRPLVLGGAEQRGNNALKQAREVLDGGKNRPKQSE